MAARSLLIAVIAAVLVVMTMAAPANVTSTAQPSAVKTAEVTLQTSQVSSASAKLSASVKSSASVRLSTAAPRPTKTAAYSTQGLPASIFPSNSYDFADTHPLNDGRKTLSLQASATGSD
ncbi:uncharacterized protein ATC70_010109 [Mucor velutinosus]|uniref:Uncharacterized protein n=1 Tax=Mucor velutinosus TaxID=708070 RepID=A0AAN7DPM8_9FUNG|nr:hypothetical protein ATC70_010109 [Mucor velutinosus]